MYSGQIDYTGHLSCIIYDERGREIDGHDYGARAGVIQTRSWLYKLWQKLRGAKVLPAALAVSFGAFALWTMHNDLTKLVEIAPVAGLVTSAGVTYLATLNNALSSFNYHDMGTGTNSSGFSTQSVSSAANVGGTIQVTFGAAHGATTNDIWTIAGITGSGISNPSTWQVTVISSTVLALVGSVGSGSYTPSSATGRLVNGAGDTALSTAAGTARVNGTNSATGNVYSTQGTITNSTGSPLVISEWGLFSASSSGTLWDRRWLNSGNSPQVTATGALTPLTTGLNPLNSVLWQYSVTLNAGGN